MEHTKLFSKSNERLDLRILLIFTLITYAFYAVNCVWLAFASIRYSPVLYFVVKAMPILCIMGGVITKICTESELDNKALALLPLVHWFFSVFYMYGNFDIFEIADATRVLITLECFVLFRSDIKIRIFNYFYWIIQICNIISLLIYLLYILNVNMGFERVPYYVDNGVVYEKWWLFAIYKGGANVRLCGIFNEPGGLGTVCALLFAARYSASKKWEKIILIITVILTYSVAGYVILLLYLALYLLKKDARNFVLIALLLSLFLYLPTLTYSDSRFNTFIHRFALTETGMAGDNRTNSDFNEVYYNLINSFKGLIGNGHGYPYPSGVLSYKIYIIQYGILGFLLWIIMWVKSSLNSSLGNKSCILLIICFFISFYQRPRLIETIYGYILLFGGIEWIKSKGEKGGETNG